MTITRPLSGSEEPRRRKGISTGWSLIVVAIAILSYAPMLIQHGQHLWQRGQFSFFPVLLAGTLVVVAAQVRESWPPDTRKWRIEPVSFYASLFALPVAVILNSPWLAACSFLGLGDSLLNRMPTARRSWRVLLVLIPLPLGYDTRFVHQMQLTSSSCASSLLDVMSVFHQMRGNILELGGRQFFVEEACSGLTSVYLFLAATWFSVACLQLRLIRAFPLILSSVWWAFVANVIRIVVIAFSHDRWNLDLTTGIPHEVTGLIVMAGALGMILMTKQMIVFMFAPIDAGGHITTNDPRNRLTPTIVWNLLTISDHVAVAAGDAVRLPFGMEMHRTKLLRLTGVVLLLSLGIYCGIHRAAVVTDFFSVHWRLP